MLAIDFDQHLKVILDPFARPITVYPLESMPDALPYSFQADGITPLRGVFHVRNLDIAQEGGLILSGATRTLTVRTSEFPVPPKQGDKILIPAFLHAPDEGYNWIDDVDDDGNGASVYTLRQSDP